MAEMSVFLDELKGCDDEAAFLGFMDLNQDGKVDLADFTNCFLQDFEYDIRKGRDEPGELTEMLGKFESKWSNAL